MEKTWLIKFQYHGEPADEQTIVATKEDAERMVEMYRADEMCAWAEMKEA